MKAYSTRVAAGLLTALLAQAAFAADAPVATVNGKAIPAVRAEAMLSEQKAQGTPESDQLKTAIKEELIRREVLSQAAIKKGLDKQPNIQAQMDLARQAVLIRAYLQDFVKNNPVTDAEIKAEYDKIKSSMGEKEYKVRHILVESEDEAKAIIAKLQKGEKFDELAKQSKDPGSKDRGGDLGWANPAMFVKPFSDAMVKLEKGKFTPTPVKTNFGYHVIMLDDTRPVTPPSLDEVKPQLTQRLQQQKVEKHMAELHDKAKID